MHLLMRLLMLLPAQNLCLYIDPKKNKPKIFIPSKHCLSSAKAIPIRKVQKFVLVQLHFMLKIFLLDAWLALWIIFEKLCEFRTILQDYNSLLNNIPLIHRT